VVVAVLAVHVAVGNLLLGCRTHGSHGASELERPAGKRVIAVHGDAVVVHLDDGHHQLMTIRTLGGSQRVLIESLARTTTTALQLRPFTPAEFGGRQ